MSPVLYNSERAFVSDDLDRADLLNEAFAAKFTDPHVQSFPDTPACPVQWRSQDFPRGGGTTFMGGPSYPYQLVNIKSKTRRNWPTILSEGSKITNKKKVKIKKCQKCQTWAPHRPEKALFVLELRASKSMREPTPEPNESLKGKEERSEVLIWPSFSFARVL